MDLDAFLDLSAAYQALSHHEPAHHEAVERFLERWEARRSAPPGDPRTD